MGDPRSVVGDLIAQYIIAGVAAVVLGVSGAMKWFSKTREKIVADQAEIGKQFSEHMRMDEERHHLHSLALNTMQNNQLHTHERLQEVKDKIDQSARDGAEEVNKMFVTVLDELAELRKDKT